MEHDEARYEDMLRWWIEWSAKAQEWWHGWNEWPLPAHWNNDEPPACIVWC